MQHLQARRVDIIYNLPASIMVEVIHQTTEKSQIFPRKREILTGNTGIIEARRKLLGLLLWHNARIGYHMSRRRSVPDVDPQTGVEGVVDADADTGSGAGSGLPDEVPDGS